MLQIAMVTAFTGYKLIRENQKGVGGYNYPPAPTQIRVKLSISINVCIAV